MGAKIKKKCEWDTETINVVASRGNLEMMKYCVAKGCHINQHTSEYAGANGHLECLKYIHEGGKEQWDWRTSRFAAENGHLHKLEYLGNTRVNAPYRSVLARINKKCKKKT